VVQHEERVPLGLLGTWWGEAGLELDVRRGDQGELGAPEVPDGLVVLGGTMGAGDDADHPWLPTTRALMVGAVEAGVPVLGVCLGHQLAAVALGGEVRPNPAGTTLGVVPFTPTPEGAADPLLAGVPGRHALHHNDDVVTRLPPGAVRLATAPDGTVQAARFAPRAWGVQFHPEATTEVYAGWLAEDAGPAELATVAAARAAAADLRRWWRPLADRFAALVAGRPAYRGVAAGHLSL
jgi:GMP synthase (glutamine-hydrolysing)